MARDVALGRDRGSRLSGDMSIAGGRALNDLRARWRARREEFARFQAAVDGAALCDELLADLDETICAVDDELLTLSQAAKVSGYSADHLGRLVRDGKLPNAGRPYSPRIKTQCIAAKTRLARARDIPHRARRT
jgi:hypothetical protein